MVRSGARQRWFRRAPQLIAATSVLAVLVALVRHGSVLVHQCVTGDGAAGWLGLRLALLRLDPACPDGGLAVGGDGHQVMGVVVMVALPALLAHVAAAGIGLSLLARLRGAVHAAVALLSAVVRALPVPVRVVVRRVRLALADVEPPVLIDVVGSAWSRRGPPLVGLV